MRLASIEAQGYRAFDKPIVLELPPRGLYQVRGFDLVTKGSSGSGKSTLVSIPAFALGYGPPATKVQSWFTGANPLKVRVVLLEGEHSLVVSRGKKLQVEVDGNRVEGNVTVQEAELQKALGVPLEVVSTLAYRRQRQRSAFLTMPDDRKKAFLAAACAAEVEGLETQIKALEKELAKSTTVTEATIKLETARRVQEALGPLPDVLAAQGALDAAQAAQEVAYGLEQAAGVVAEDLEAQEREQWAAKKAQATERVKAARAVLDVTPVPVDAQALLDDARLKLAECERAIQAAEGEERARRQAWEEQRNARAEKVKKTERLWAESPKAKRRSQELFDQLARYDQQLCPTCVRPWLDEAACKARAKLFEESEQHHYQIKLDAGHMATYPVGSVETWEQLNPWIPNGKLEALQRAVKILQSRVDRAKWCVDLAREQSLGLVEAELKAAMAEAINLEHFAGSIELIQAKGRLETCGYEARRAQDRLDEAAREVLRIRQAAAKVTKAQEGVRVAELALGEAVWKLNEIGDTLEAVKAFLSKWFDEVLLEVSDEVNQILAEVPNVKHCVFSFKSEVTNKDGELSRRAIVPVLTIGGHDLSLNDVDGASGGMLSSVELAVDLGVLRVIERRTQRRVGWLVVDEAFEGLDAPSREACVEVLRNEAKDRLVLVVDHFGEIAGLFDYTLTVKHEAGRAYLA